MPLAPLASEILDFWFVPREGEAPSDDEPTALRGARRVSRSVWFQKNAAFDAEIRDRFGPALAAGLAGAFGEWCATPQGSLARVVLLDQFTRNAFRGSAAAFDGDRGALATAEQAIGDAFDRDLDPYERWFLYMPFVHSELPSMQDRALALFTALASETGLGSPLTWAARHREVIARFGRFPHRNALLGREPTPDEIAFLGQPGSRF